MGQGAGLREGCTGRERIRRAELRQRRLRIVQVLHRHKRHPLRQREWLWNSRAEATETLTDGVSGKQDLRAEIGKSLAVENPKARPDHRFGREVIRQAETRR